MKNPTGPQTDSIDFAKPPHRFDKNRHTRRAYSLGYDTGFDARPMVDIEDFVETEPREYEGMGNAETIRRVGYECAQNSRDTGMARGLSRLNTLEDIADDGVTLSRFCHNGDSCMLPVYGGASSGVVTDRRHLIDETLEAYDTGFARGFADRDLTLGGSDE